MKLKLFISGFILSCLLINSQETYGQAELEALLQGKNKLSDIMLVVDQYYRDHPEENKYTGEGEEFESPLLHWKRWEWFMSGRLGPQGELVNIPERMIAGLREKDKMATSGDRNINSGWTFMGPSSSPLQNNSAQFNGIGRVDRIVFHPTNANIIFLCTPAGGLWNTLNGGASWNNLTDNLPSVGISGFVISYANTSIQYLLTGDGDASSPGGLNNLMGYVRPSIGVLKSIDGGVSWHQTGTLPGTSDPLVGFKMVQSPTNPEVLLVATNSGLYRTDNGGATWSKRVSGVFYDIEFKPGDGNRCYASIQGDFYLSTDAGMNWNSNSTYNIDPAACTSPNGGGRIAIAVAPTAPTKVYLLSGPTGTGLICGVWLSTDSGASFTRQSNSPNILGSSDFGGDNDGQTFYDLALACRSDNSSVIVSGGLTVWRSDNGGVSWTHCTSYQESGIYPYIHPDIHDIAYNVLNNYLYVASDGGFFKSTDHGVTWTDLSPNIETSMFYHMRGWDGNVNKLMGGLQDNGVKYRLTNSSAFYHIDGADGFDVVFNPDNGQPGYSTINSSVLAYSNNGANSTDKTPDEDSLFFKTIAIHNTNPDTILVGTSDIFRSYNGGSSYSNRGASGSWALTSCPSNNFRFYAAGGAGFWNGSGNLYFSDDIGATWTVKSNTSGFPAASGWVKITDVTVRPTNSSTVWACFGGFNAGNKVVMSTNTGDSWTNMSANLPNVPVNCLAVDNDNGVYAGTDIGVFYRGPTMSLWMPWSNGLPNVPVTDLFIFDDGSTKLIRASTFGRGVWQSAMASTCDAAVVVTGGLEGIRHYEASTSITSSAFIQGGIGTFVSFKSGSYITLGDGFNVIDDSEFLGVISPCGTGGIPAAEEDISINRSDPNSAIILLRRMWNPDTELPYGSIHSLLQQNNKAQVIFSIREPGDVQLYVAKAVQEKLTPVYSGTTGAGIHEMNFDVSNLNHEEYYLLLFYEGKLAHFQELDLR